MANDPKKPHQQGQQAHQGEQNKPQQPQSNPTPPAQENAPEAGSGQPGAPGLTPSDGAGSGLNVSSTPATPVTPNKPADPATGNITGTGLPGAPADAAQEHRQALENKGDTTTGTDVQAVVTLLKGGEPTLEGSAKAAVDNKREEERVNAGGVNTNPIPQAAVAAEAARRAADEADKNKKD